MKRLRWIPGQWAAYLWRRETRRAKQQNSFLLRATPSHWSLQDGGHSAEKRTGFRRRVRHHGKTRSHVTQFTCSRHLLPMSENWICPPGSVKHPSLKPTWWRAVFMPNTFMSIILRGVLNECSLVVRQYLSFVIIDNRLWTMRFDVISFSTETNANTLTSETTALWKRDFNLSDNPLVSRDIRIKISSQFRQTTKRRITRHVSPRSF